MSIKILLRKTKAFLQRIINYALGGLGGLDQTVVFECYGGKHYSDNPKAISEKMHALYPEYRIIWGMISESLRTKENIPQYVEIYPIQSLRYRRIRSKAIALVRNEVMTDDLSKRKGQLFIQTWHGDRGIKKILFDSLDARGLSHELYNFYDYKLTDCFVIGSDYAENRIRTAFKYTGMTLKKGCPRNDCLVTPTNGETIRKAIGILPGYKVVLYAPTLRRNSQLIKGNIDINQTLNTLSRDGNEWICLVRAHPKSLGIEIIDGSDIIDVTDYPDMADLLVIADVLITDYSSCAGDYIITKRPLILAQFDYETYLQEDRSLNIDLEEAGFFIAKNQDELNNLIENTSLEDFSRNDEKLCHFFGIHESGQSAEEVCHFIHVHDASKKETSKKCY